jgi:outer membrane protein
MWRSLIVRGLGIALLFPALALCASGTEPFPTLNGAPGGLLDSPIPFYHDYNMASLFPLGRHKKKAAAVEKTSYSLEECINLALEKNPDHNIARENLRATMGDIVAAWGLYTPTMFTTYGINQSAQTSPFTGAGGQKQYFTRLSNSSVATLGLSFNVFNQARMYFGLRNAYYLRGQVRSDLHDSELALIDQVRAAYFDVLRQEELLKAANEQADQLRGQLKQAEARFRVGEVTKLDVLQARIDLQNQELQITVIDNQLLTARIDLDVVVGGAMGRNFNLEDNFEVREYEFDPDALVAETLERHPALISLELNLRQQKGNLWMGRMAYLPVVKATVGYTHSDNGLVLDPNNLRSSQVAISASWNILDGWTRFQQNRYADVAVHNAGYELEKARLVLSRNVRVSYLELIRLYQNHLTLAESMELARQSLQLEQRRYALGASDMVALRKAQADYSQAEVNYINSVYDFQAALSTLSRNVGRDLSGDFK